MVTGQGRRPKIAALYTRVSRLDQVDDETLARMGKKARAGGGRHSLPSQQAKLMEFYEEHLKPLGYEYLLVNEAAVSAYKRRLCYRPEGSQMCGLLQPGDCVVTRFSSRLFRNHLDMMATYGGWRLRGITLYCLNIPTSLSPNHIFTDFIVMVKGFFDEMEAEANRERRMDSIEYAREIGAKYGQSKPWGYRWAGPRRQPGKCWLTPDYLELAILLELRRCRQLGATWEKLQDVMARAVVKLEGAKYKPVARFNARTWGIGSIRKGMQAIETAELQTLAAELDEPLRAQLWRIDYPAILREWPPVRSDEWLGRRTFLNENALPAKG